MAFCLYSSQIELNLFCLVFYFSQSNTNNRILTFICEDVEPEECVVICHQGKEVELELKDDQSLLFSTLKSQWSTATGLFYWPNEKADNNRSRGIKMTGEKFLPPNQGWGNRVYHVVTSDKDGTTKGINIK